MADHDDTELADPGAEHARGSACPEMPGWMREQAARTAGGPYHGAAWEAEAREEEESAHGYGGIYDDDDLFDENVGPAVLAARDLAEDHFSDPTEPVLIVDSADADSAAENTAISPALTPADPTETHPLTGTDDWDYNNPEPTDRTVQREARGEETPAHTWTELQASADAVAAEEGPKAAQEWFNSAVDAQDGSAVGIGATEFEGGGTGRDTVAEPAAARGWPGRRWPPARRPRPAVGVVGVRRTV